MFHQNKVILCINWYKFWESHRIVLEDSILRDDAASQSKQFLMFQRAAGPLTSQYAPKGCRTPHLPVCTRLSHSSSHAASYSSTLTGLCNNKTACVMRCTNESNSTDMNKPLWPFSLLLLQLPRAHLSRTTSTGWNIRKSYNWRELELLYWAACMVWGRGEVCTGFWWGNLREGISTAVLSCIMIIFPSSFIQKIGVSTIIVH
jgi:hypothetical protein